MFRLSLAIKVIFLFAFCFISPFFAQSNDNLIDKVKIEQITGLKGSFDKKEGVFKITLPRKDVSITVDDWPMPPFMGLTSWVSFMPGVTGETMIMGDLVLFQDEVNPVMSELLNSGISVTALHNHFFYEKPKIYFMHINGEGRTKDLATAVGKVFSEIKEIRRLLPAPARKFNHPQIAAKSSITPKIIEDILKVKGSSQDGMFKIVIGRSTRISCGCTVGKEMGVNTWAGFAGTDNLALMDGDFAMLESEVQPVLKALRKAQINIVALHNHMLTESPRIVFLHFWGVGSTTDLAKGLKAALSVQENQGR